MTVYEYHLKFWGGIQNEDQNWIEKELNIKETDFWFDSEEKRQEFRKILQDIANKHNCCIVFSEHEGFDVRQRTVATVIMQLPNGKQYLYTDDFGYGYSEDLAEFVWHEGNWACDCNRSSSLSQVYPEVSKLPCGDTIEVIDFKVERV